MILNKDIIEKSSMISLYNLLLLGKYKKFKTSLLVARGLYKLEHLLVFFSVIKINIWRERDREAKRSLAAAPLPLFVELLLRISSLKLLFPYI